MGRDYIYREHKRRSEQRAGDHSVNCGKEFGFGISAFIRNAKESQNGYK